MPSPMPYRKVAAMLKAKGYQHTHTSGSHHVWKNATNGVTFSVPVHSNQVKPVYVKQIQNLP